MAWIAVLIGLALVAAAAGAILCWRRAEAERRRLADELERERARQAEQIRESTDLQGIGVLAGGVAHDLNNLLVPVLANAELLAERLRGDAEGTSLVHDVHAAASRAAELARQMLAYSGRGQAQVGRIDASALIRDMARVLEATARHAATLRFELQDRLPPVLGDEVRLRQVVLNLVVNAAEAIVRPPGNIAVRTGTARLEGPDLAPALSAPGARPGDHVFIEVEDDGPGMAEALLSRAFDPMVSTKDKARGLGLSVVLGVARFHRGVVQVDTREGLGTRIRVSLPVEGEAAAAAEAARGRATTTA